jgi:predicted ester cyclase
MSEHTKWICTHLMEEVFNRGNGAVADAFVAPDFHNHEMPTDAPRGPEAFTAPARWLRSAFPDLHAVLHEVVVEGDLVVGRITLSGTHQGDYLGVLGTGRSFAVQHIHMYRVRDGKLIEHWACRDDLGQLTQLGWVLQPPA